MMNTSHTPRKLSPSKLLGFRFAPEIERRFILDYVEARQSVLRGACALSLLLYAGYAAAHLSLFLGESLLILSFGLSTASSIAMIAATSKWPRSAFIPWAVVAALAVNAWALVFCVVAPACEMPFDFLLVNILYSFLLTGLLFNLAVPLAVSTLLLYSIVGSQAAHPVTDVTDHVSTLAIFVFLCAVASYLYERAERRSWSQANRHRELAFLDDLTGLGNRRHFFREGEKRIQQALRVPVPISLLIIDIDHFKLFNDLYGHGAGDVCIRNVAALVGIVGRRPLDLSARIGGEEFVVLFYDCEKKEALRRAAGLIEQLSAIEMEHSHSPFGRVTVSIGAAESTDQTPLTLVDLLAAADLMMYRVKEAGRNDVQ